MKQEKPQTQNIKQEQQQQEVYKNRHPVRADALKELQTRHPHKADKHKSVTQRDEYRPIDEGFGPRHKIADKSKQPRPDVRAEGGVYDYANSRKDKPHIPYHTIIRGDGKGFTSPLMRCCGVFYLRTTPS